jgi:cell division protein ZapA
MGPVPEPTQETHGATSVTIYGRTYQLRGHHDPDYLIELAAMVDERMREVVSATGTADTLKVAILAALNLADETLQAGRKDAPGKRSRETEKRLAALVTMLDEALAE